MPQAPLYNEARKAAEVHRQVRQHMRSVIKPGVRLFDMVEQLEDCTRTLIEASGLEAGVVRCGDKGLPAAWRAELMVTN